MSRWLLVVLVAVAAVAAPTAAAADDAAPPDTVALDNEFIPEDRELSECISALPEPGCGSENRSGWRQWAVLGVIVAALAFIAWRIARAARHARRST